MARTYRCDNDGKLGAPGYAVAVKLADHDGESPQWKHACSLACAQVLAASEATARDAQQAADVAHRAKVEEATKAELQRRDAEAKAEREHEAEVNRLRRETELAEAKARLAAAKGGR